MRDLRVGDRTPLRIHDSSGERHSLAERGISDIVDVVRVPGARDRALGDAGPFRAEDDDPAGLARLRLEGDPELALRVRDGLRDRLRPRPAPRLAARLLE